jgi:putative thioredoxin
MVKLDIDKNQQIAAQMQIRSVPTVIMFKNGQPVDAFAGVKTASEIREFIAKHADDLAPSPEEELQAQAFALLENGDFKEAGSLFSQLLQKAPENTDAAAGLISCLLKLKDYDVAGQVIAGLHPKIGTKPEILALKAELETALQLGGLGEKAEFEAKILANTDDFSARMDLSLILWAENSRDAAAEQLLYIIEKDRGFEEDGARKQLLKFFEMAGPMDEFTVAARKKLSILLFS